MTYCRSCLSSNHVFTQCQAVTDDVLDKLIGLSDPTSVAERYCPVVVKTAVASISAGLELVPRSQDEPRLHNSRCMSRSSLCRTSLWSVNRLSLLIRKTKREEKTNGTRMFTRVENLSEGVLLGINRNQPVPITSHQRAALKIDTASTGDFSHSHFVSGRKRTVLRTNAHGNAGGKRHG